MKRFLVVITIAVSVLSISCENSDNKVVNKAGVYKASGDDNTINFAYPDDNTNIYDGNKCGVNTYPCPPYGLKLYQRMENFPFIPVGNSADLIAGPSGIAWMDSLYKMKDEGYKLAFLTISTGWCGYCEAQAGVLSSNIATSYEGEVAFLTVIVQDGQGNDSGADYALSYANAKHLNQFDNVFISYDPVGLFQRYMNIQAFPFNAFINLKTMEILSFESSLYTFDLYSTAVTNALSKVN